MRRVRPLSAWGVSPRAPGLRPLAPRPSLAPPGHSPRVTKPWPPTKQPNLSEDRKRKERRGFANQRGGCTQSPSAHLAMGHSERPGRHENRPYPGDPGPGSPSAQAPVPFRACAVPLRARQPRSPAPATPRPLHYGPLQSEARGVAGGVRAVAAAGRLGWEWGRARRFGGLEVVRRRRRCRTPSACFLLWPPGVGH